MAKLLFHVTSGPENTTKGALGLLIARTAVDEGHAIGLLVRAIDAGTPGQQLQVARRF